MEAALKKRETGWKHFEKECEAPQKDATFTEIYELIYHNQTMVRSELGVLLQLIQKKLMEKVGATPAFTGSNVCWTYGKAKVASGIRPSCK